MKKFPAALASAVLAFSAASAKAELAPLTPGPNEVLVTARQVLIGENVHNFKVTGSAPAMAVTIIDLHDPARRSETVSCDQMKMMTMLAGTLTPAERLENALSSNDHPVVRALYKTKVTVSDAEGPVDAKDAHERARLAVAERTIANSDRMLETALKICAPLP